MIRTIAVLGKTLNFWQLLKDGAVPYAVTIGLIGFLVWASLRFRSWYHNDSGLAADDHEMLIQFRDLQRRGGLTAEEFRSIKGRLVNESSDSVTTGTDADNQQGRANQDSSDHQIGQIGRNDN